MYPLRTKFKKEIICEFLPPVKKSNKVIILAAGAPGYPKKNELLSFLSEKGYWVFLPRYRGSWESGGSFLEKSPHEDLLDIMDELPKGFIDILSRKKYTIAKPEIYIIGGSFGGPAALLASKDPRVKKAVALASVIDWRIDGKDEPMHEFERFVKEGFMNGYRFTQKNWDKLKNGTFYNPIAEWAVFDPRKILLVHGKKDGSCPIKLAEKFAYLTGCYFTLLPDAEHMGVGGAMEPRIWKSIQKFFKEKN
jgi:hypothetical protein